MMLCSSLLVSLEIIFEVEKLSYFKAYKCIFAECLVVLSELLNNEYCHSTYYS